MADQNAIITQVPLKLHDNGDGTVSLVAYIPAGTNALGGVIATGDVASGSADGTSKPVKVAGRYNSAGISAPSDGQRVDLQMDQYGNVKVVAGGTTVLVAAPLTRPSNTTPYTANGTVSDSVSATTPLVLAGMARVNGGSGYITKVSLWTNQAANTARFKVHFYTATTGTITITADGAAYTLLWANRAYKVGSLLLPAMTTEGAGSDAARANNITDRLPFVCANGSTTLYAVLETLDAFTPTSGQLFYLSVGAEQN